jgi:hypothetical protein
MDIVIDEAELRRMSAEERGELARALARIDLPHPMSDPRQLRRRRLGLMVMTSACVILAVWIGLFIKTLPIHFTVRHWRGVWIVLDLAELLAFAATAWAAWRQRQIVVVLMIVTGTLLLCDAWFDVALEYGTKGFRMSVVLAAVVEVPFAIMLFAGARRLIRLSVYSLMRLEGVTGPLPPLRRIPLFADGLEEALPHRFRQSVTPKDRVSSH